MKTEERFSPAQLNYMDAKKKHEEIKEIEINIKTLVLSENVFMTEPEEGEVSERILAKISDYRMSESDFERYLKLCFAGYKKAGLDVPSWDISPTYKSFPVLKQAEKELIDWGCSVMKKLPQYKMFAAELDNLKEIISWNLEVRQKAIDITLMV